MEVFDHVLRVELACGAHFDHHRLYTDSRQQHVQYVHCCAAMAGMSNAWRAAVLNKSSLWNTYSGRIHSGTENFYEWTLLMGPGPVDLRLVF